MSDLSTISTLRQRRFEQKNVTGPSNGAETNILNITGTGGIVKYIWLADRPGSGGGYPQFDHSIRVYTDGNTTPDMDMDLGVFFGYGYGEIFSQENITSTHWHARSGTAAHINYYGGGFRLEVPFTTSIRICVANVNNTPPSSVFSQVDYVLASDNPGMTIPPYVLKSTGSHWIGGTRATVAAGSNATLATIPAGNPGIIVGHSMCGGNTSDYSYLERYVALYIDGEATPSIQSSGTEDWFTASDYFFNGQTPFSSHGSMGLGAGPYNQNGTPVNAFSALVDILALNGGYPFTSSASLVWLNHPAATVGNVYATCLWYYRHT
jgi:hypothetical protein